METPEIVPKNRLLSVAERLAAVLALVAFFCLFVAGRGHRVLNNGISPHVWFEFSAAVCLVVGTIMRERSRAPVIASQLAALVLLGFSIAALRHGK